MGAYSLVLYINKICFIIIYKYLLCHFFEERRRKEEKEEERRTENGGPTPK